jgi:hypothetical protein
MARREAVLFSSENETGLNESETGAEGRAGPVPWKVPAQCGVFSTPDRRVNLNLLIEETGKYRGSISIPLITLFLGVSMANAIEDYTDLVDPSMTSKGPDSGGIIETGFGRPDFRPGPPTRVKSSGGT